MTFERLSNRRMQRCRSEALHCRGLRLIQARFYRRTHDTFCLPLLGKGLFSTLASYDAEMPYSGHATCLLYSKKIRNPPTGTSLQFGGDERGERKEGISSGHSKASCSNKHIGSSFLGESGGPHIDEFPRQRPYNAVPDEEDEVRVADYLPDSVYVWACGEKLHPSDEDVTASEIAVGWVTILVQVAAYLVLIVGATSNDEEVSYSIYSISLAMFLMISISASDIRASHALLFWGRSWGQCLFGAVLMGCTGLLMTASLRVLFMDAGNNAELVIGATTVLFIEDVDNKLATLMTTVPNKWRLFWMLEILSVSFWLAFIGVIHFGNSAAVLDKEIRSSGVSLQEIIGHALWGPIPWILTMWCILLSHVLVNTPRACTTLRRTHETSVLPVSSVPSQDESVQQNGRNICQESPAGGFCLFLSIAFVVMEVFTFGYAMPVIVYSFGVLVLFTAGALRAVSCSNGTCSWREIPGSLQSTWYRVFVGWGLGTFVYLVYYCVPSSVPSFVVEYPPLAVDLVLILEPTFFGKWGEHWVRILQECTMSKNGCIYWAVYFHVVYSAAWWTMHMVGFMIAGVD